MNFSEFYKLPILGILRDVKEEMLEPLSKVIISSGLKAIEITTNTENAGELIKKLRNITEDKILIGAGTVLNMNELETALRSGAQFIVMPVIVSDIMYFCVNNNIPVFPGALTPNEIYKAWNMGATMVKVFPSSLYGPKYFKEVKAPLNNIRLLACGGVSNSTIKEFFDNGASGAAFGASIFKNEWLTERRFDLIEGSIKDLLTAYNKVK